MSRFNSPLKYAFAGAFLAGVLLLPIYVFGTVLLLVNAALHLTTGEHAGELIGSNGVWVVALILLAGCVGLAYGCYEAFIKKPTSEK